MYLIYLVGTIDYKSDQFYHGDSGICPFTCHKCPLGETLTMVRSRRIRDYSYKKERFSCRKVIINGSKLSCIVTRIDNPGRGMPFHDTGLRQRLLPFKTTLRQLYYGFLSAK